MSFALSCAGPVPTAAPSLQLHGLDDPCRAEVERFIAVERHPEVVLAHFPGILHSP